jgi:mono/diheme cytochrome c family protein
VSAAFVRTMIVVIGLGTSLAAAPPQAKPDEKVAKGQTVYGAQKCATCHSIAGKGNKANPLDGIGAKMSADEIKQWIVNPTEMTAKTKSTKKPPMPAKWSKLPAEELDALVAYLASLK